MNLDNIERRMVNFRPELYSLSAADDAGGTASSATDCPLPAVERSVIQMLKVVEDMCSNVSHRQQKSVNATRMLASEGFQVLDKKVADLHLLNENNSEMMNNVVQPTGEVSLTSYLQQQRDNIFTECLSETSNHVIKESRRRCAMAETGEWEREKKLITQIIANSNENLDIAPKSLFMKDIGEKLNMQGNSTMKQLGIEYAKIIKEYNTAILDGKFPALVDMICVKVGDFTDKLIAETWKIVSAVLDSSPSLTTSDQVVRAGGNADNGLLLESRHSDAAQTRLVERSISYLQRDFLKKMIDEVKHSTMTGVCLNQPLPDNGTLGVLCRFYALKYQELKYTPEDGELIYDTPYWAVLYLALRSGEYDVCVSLLDKVKSLPIYETMVEYFKSGCKLRGTQKKEMKQYFKRTSNNSNDPFKKTVLSIMCKCNLEDATFVLTIEDIIWINLSHISLEKKVEHDSSFVDFDAEERITLESIQYKLAVEYGESFFKSNEKPLSYFNMLMLIGHFELALDFIFKHQQYRIHALHVALVLHEMNVLQVPVNHLEKLLTKHTHGNIHFFNISTIVIQYVKPLMDSNIEEAINYLYFLRNLYASSSRENIFKMQIIKMICNNENQLPYLIGQSNGEVKTPGILHKFIADLNDICNKAAEKMEPLGKELNAIILYDLSKNYEKVIDMLINCLSEIVIHKTTAKNESIFNLALNIANRYKENSINPVNIGVFFTLLNLDIFFKSVYSANYSHAYMLLGKINLLPQTLMEINNCINQVEVMSDKIRAIYPSLFRTSMRILHQLFNDILQNQKSQLTLIKEQEIINELNRYKSEAKVLCKFASKIPYKIPMEILSEMREIENNMKF